MWGKKEPAAPKPDAKAEQSLASSRVSELAKSQSNPHAASANISQAQNQLIKKLKAELEEKSKQNVALEDELQKATVQLERQLQEQTANAQRLQIQLDAASHELNVLRTQEAKKEESKLTTSRVQNAEFELRYQKLKADFDGLAKRVEEETKAKISALDELTVYKAQCEDLRIDNEKLLSENELLQQQMQEHDEKNMAVTAKSKEMTTGKPRIQITDDDEPEVFGATETAPIAPKAGGEGAQGGQGISNKEREAVSFAFKEAERTIVDLQEQVQHLKNELILVKRNAENERQERRAEMDDLVKEAEEKEQEVERLSAELEAMKLMEQNDKIFTELKQKSSEGNVQFKDNPDAQPLPVFHTLVNPSALHNARQEYTLLKNEVMILKTENDILKRKLRELDEMQLNNQVLERKVTNLSALAAANGSERAMRAKELSSKFSAVDLQSKLDAARNTSMRETQRSVLQGIFDKVGRAGLNVTGALQIDSKQSSESSAVQPEQTAQQVAPQSTFQMSGQAQPTIKELEDYIQDLPEDKLREEHKELLSQVREMEEELNAAKLKAGEAEVYGEAVAALQADKDELHRLLLEAETTLADYKANGSTQGADRAKVLALQKEKEALETQLAIKQASLQEKGVQCSITYAVAQQSKEVQAGQFRSQLERITPVLVANDGMQIRMDTDQRFRVLKSGPNGMDKVLRVQKNIVTDEADQKVDFNGIYKDQRGAFAVVHGVIDKIPQETPAEAFDLRQAEMQGMQQLDIYRKETIRLEAENEALASALNKARKALAEAKNCSIQELLLENEGPMDSRKAQMTQETQMQTDFVQQGYIQQQQGAENGQVAQILGQCLGAIIQNSQGGRYQPQPQEQGARSFGTPVQSGGQNKRAITQGTSPEMPQYHADILSAEVDKEVQTDLYVVPVEQLLLEREKTQQYAKENTRLVVRLQKQAKLEEEIAQRTKEFQLSVKHIQDLNTDLSEAQKLNLDYRQQIAQLQSQIQLTLQNKGQYSDVFMLTNQHHQDMFDGLRQRLAQKEAQIADLQRILQDSRAESARQIQELGAQIESFKAMGDDVNALRVATYKQDLQLQQQKLQGTIQDSRFAAKLYDFEQVNQNVELELRNALRENKKLAKAGQMIKDAFQAEQNRCNALQMVSQRLKNALVLMCNKQGWADIEILLHQDDSLQTLELLISERLGVNISKMAQEALQEQRETMAKIRKVRNIGNATGAESAAGQTTGYL